VTEDQTTALLGLLDRCAVALEANATLYKKHMAEDSRRHQLSEKRYAEQMKVQRESIKRSEETLHALRRADDRQEFLHDLNKTILGLKAPDYIPETKEAT
jgi:hypothetical protein